jgi:hypothetical protein
MNQEDCLFRLAEHLDAASIPFMLAGSFSSSHHGQPRASNDVDLVIDPSAQQFEGFLQAFENETYVSFEAARDALRRRSMFNVIDLKCGWKADLIIRKYRPFSVEEFGRRQLVAVHGRQMPMASPEDVILTKLEWHKISPSDRQLLDAFNVAIVQGAKLDLGYLRKWAIDLGVEAELEEILAKAQTFPDKGQPAEP